MLTASTLVALTFEHYITIGGLVAPTVSVAVGLVLGEAVRRVGRKADDAHDAAKLAATRSEPTSNGFAQGVRDHNAATDARLARIEGQIDTLTTAVLTRLDQENTP